MAEKKNKALINLEVGSTVWVVWHFVEAAIFLVLGILAIVFSGNKDWQTAFLIVVGAIIIADGVLRILVNYIPMYRLTAATKGDLTYGFVISGALEIAFGITLIVDSGAAEAVALFCSYFFGILLIVAGISIILISIALGVRRLERVWMVVLYGILGGVLMALGIWLLVALGQALSDNSYDTGSFYQIVLIMVGVVAIVAGVVELVITCIGWSAARKARIAAEGVEKAANDVKEVVDAVVSDDESKPIEHKDENAPSNDESKPSDDNNPNGKDGKPEGDAPKGKDKPE